MIYLGNWSALHAFSNAINVQEMINKILKTLRLLMYLVGKYAKMLTNGVLKHKLFYNMNMNFTYIYI